MAGDEVGDQVLLLARLLARRRELPGEDAEVVDLGFFIRASTVGVACALGRPSAVTADVVRGQFLDVARGQLGARSMRMPLATRDLVARPATLRGPSCISSMSRAVVGPQQLANARDGRTRAACTSPPPRGASSACWYMFAVGPPMSLTMPLKSSGRPPSPDLGQMTDSSERETDDAALVGRDRAEGAAAEAAAHDRHRILDHLEGGDRLV